MLYHFDGYDKDDVNEQNKVNPQKLVTNFTNNIKNPSSLYAINGYIHLGENSASGILTGTSGLYGWANNHELGHMLDNSVLVEAECTNNLYSIHGARYWYQKQWNQAQVTGKTYDFSTAYHPNLLAAQNQIDKNLTSLITTGVSTGTLEGNIWEKVTSLYNSMNYFNEYDYSDYNFDSSPYTKEINGWLKEYGTYGAGLRLIRLNPGEFIPYKIKGGTVNAFAVAMSQATGFNLAKYFKSLGANITVAALEACEDYPDVPVKLQYYSLDADKMTVTGVSTFNDQTKATFKLNKTDAGYQLTLSCEEEEDTNAAFIYEIYKNDTLIGFARATDNKGTRLNEVTYVDTTSSTDETKAPNYTVIAYDAQLNPSLPSTPERTVYLSDIEWMSQSTSYGTIRRDQSHDGIALTLLSSDGTPVTYTKGVGMHAAGEITVNLRNKGYNRFDVTVGVLQKYATARYSSTVKYLFYLDDVLVYQTGIMRYNTPKQDISLNVTGKSKLKIVVSDGGNGNLGDWGVLANAKLSSR